MVKRTVQENETFCFEIYSVISTSKNGETKVCQAFDELESLFKNNGGSNVREQLIKKVNNLINKTVQEEEKMEEDLDFFLDNNIIKKKKKKIDEERKDRT